MKKFERCSRLRSTNVRYAAHASDAQDCQRCRGYYPERAYCSKCGGAGLERRPPEQGLAATRKRGWYWIRLLDFGGTYGPWTPALWRPEFKSWASAEFSGIPDSGVLLGAEIESP